MKDLCSSRNDERYRLDVVVVDGLESSHYFVFVYIESTFWHERHTALRIRRFIFRQILKRIILIFIVPNVAITVIR